MTEFSVGDIVRHRTVDTKSVFEILEIREIEWHYPSTIKFWQVRSSGVKMRHIAGPEPIKLKLTRGVHAHVNNLVAVHPLSILASSGE